MMKPALEALLILQDRDLKRRNLEAQLKAVPADIAAVEAKIAGEKQAIENARGELKTLETKKKTLETEIGSAEDKLGKYKTQQMQVRKNDEYQALGQEIAHMQEAIGKLEETELELLYAIDEAKKVFAAAEATLKANISGHEARIKQLRDREAALKIELTAAAAEYSASREPAGEAALRVYDRVAMRYMPAAVPVHAGKCAGCHLKVSSETESAARGKTEALFAHCDQCGRIVWWENA